MKIPDQFKKLITVFLFTCVFALGASEVVVIQINPNLTYEDRQETAFVPRLTVSPQNQIVVAATPGIRIYDIQKALLVANYTVENLQENCISRIYTLNVQYMMKNSFVTRLVGCRIISIDTTTFSQTQVLFNFREFSKEPSINNFAISPDGQLLAASTNWCYVCVWNIATKQLVSELKAEQTFIKETESDLAFSPDSQVLAVGAGQFWFRKTGQSKYRSIYRGTAFMNMGTRVRFAPDGKSIFVAGDSKFAQRIEVATGKVLTEYNNAADADTIALSPNGQWVAVSGLSRDFKIRLFQASTGKLLKTFAGHANRITDVIFSNDSKVLISSSQDSTIRLWKLQ